MEEKVFTFLKDFYESQNTPKCTVLTNCKLIKTIIEKLKLENKQHYPDYSINFLKCNVLIIVRRLFELMCIQVEELLKKNRILFNDVEKSKHRDQVKNKVFYFNIYCSNKHNKYL